MLPTFNRRGFLTMSVGVGAAAALSSCGTSGPSTSASVGGGSNGEATLWSLTAAPNETIHDPAVQRYNQLSDRLGTVSATYFQNDAYKQKIRMAIGAGEAPDAFYGWGGGGLRTWVDSGSVLDLTDWLEEDGFKDKFVANAWPAGSVDARIYGMPINATNPVVMFYNNELFDQAGANQPTTWDELMGLVESFNSKGIAPISLAGQSRWTSMMYLECILDRVAAPEVFKRILAGEQDAWLDDSVVQMGQRVQELVDANAFVQGFASMATDNSADYALLWTGKAAMLLQLSSGFARFKNEGGDFISAGKLGYSLFPSITGGAGDGASLAGNPCSYFSINAAASEEQQNIMKDFFKRGFWTEETLQAYVDGGSVPVFTGAEDMINASDDSEFLGFVSDAFNAAPNFTQSWDQALEPTAAEALLSNIDELFLKNITPEQFAENMNAASKG